jgi:hypothetical protein
MLRTLSIFLLLLSSLVQSEYKNTNGEEIDKSIKDLIRWQKNQKKPVLSSIKISDEWKNIDLNNDQNYMIWIGHSTFLIKKNNFVILTDPVFSKEHHPSSDLVLKG